jgi:hypothetical protein
MKMNPWAGGALAVTLALSAQAQTYDVASSVGGQQNAAAPINQTDIYNRINAAQGTANSAQGTANDAQWRATSARETADRAQNSANWAGQVAQNAQSTANQGVRWADTAWGYARAVNISNCTMSNGGTPAAQTACTIIADNLFPHPQ